MKSVVIDVGKAERVERSVVSRCSGYGTQVFAVVDAEFTKLRHDPWELVTRVIQPMLWLTLFGGVMGRIKGLSSGDLPYIDFLSAGILAQSVLFVSIFYGISAIWERDMGVLHRYLVSPAPRSALVLGKALSSSFRGLSQATFIYICSAFLGVSVSFEPWSMLTAILLVILGSGLFSSFSLIIACLVKTRERFMGIGQILTMPIFFASNAIYPIALMPSWLKTISVLNPLSYLVDGLRAVMLRNGHSSFGIGHDLIVLTLFAATMIAIATKMYPRLTE